MKRFTTAILWAVAAGLLTPAVASETGKPVTPQDQGFGKIIRMAKAMGGIEPVLSLQGQRITAAGNRFEPEQTLRPGDEPLHLAGYHYTLTRKFTARKLHTEWAIDALYPIITEWHYTEIINGEHGAVLGFDTIIAPPQAPMLSTRIGARTKQHLVASPLALIRHAAEHADAVRFSGVQMFDGKPHQVVILPGWEQPIRLFIDVATKLPTKADTLEDDSVYGDALWEVMFEDWVDVNGIRVPTRLTHYLNGRRINEETREAVDLYLDLDDELFAIPADLKRELDPELFAWGERSSQWFGRFLPAGIPFDLDQTGPETVFIEEIAPEVFHVRALTHHSLIVEMNDHLVAIEPPLYDQRTQAVLDAVGARWPDKPIKYIIASHFHNDHIGGVRGYGAIGAALIIGKDTEGHYEAIFDAPHTVYPDAFSSNPRDVEIITVAPENPLLLTDGARTIRIFDVPNRHAIGMLVPYIEDAKLVFVSDLYNPELFAAPIPQLFSLWSVDLLEGLEASGLDIQWLAGAHGGVTSYAQFVADVEASQ